MLFVMSQKAVIGYTAPSRAAEKLQRPFPNVESSIKDRL